MNTGILHINLKKRALFSGSERNVRKWMILFEPGIYRTLHTIICSSHAINPTHLIIGG